MTNIPLTNPAEIVELISKSIEEWDNDTQSWGWLEYPDSMETYIAKAYLDKIVGEGLYTQEMEELHVEYIEKVISKWEDYMYSSEADKSMKTPDSMEFYILRALTGEEGNKLLGDNHKRENLKAL